jgi:hypothetical protein
VEFSADSVYDLSTEDIGISIPRVRFNFKYHFRRAGLGWTVVPKVPVEKEDFLRVFRLNAMRAALPE